MYRIGTIAAAVAVALSNPAGAHEARPAHLSCGASATSSVTRGEDGATVLSCNYAPDPGYHPSHDGGPWVHVDLLNDSEAALRQVRDGTSGTLMFPNGPAVPPLELVHTYICVSDPYAAWNQCPLDYPDNPGNAGLGYRLNPALIARLEAGFLRLRAAGLKTILRFTYNYPDNADTAEQTNDAPLDVILHHMRLLAPVLQRNADLIAALQAGFIGKWGEWHQSHFPDNDTAGSHDVFLDRFRQLFSRFTQLEVRYPYALLDYNAHLLGPSAPFDVTGVGLGMHNDAFAASVSDEGTFLPETSEPGLPAPIQYTPEQLMDASAEAGAAFTQTGVASQLYVKQSCAAFPGYAQSLSLSSLNVEFSTQVLQDWSDNGCLPQILANVGPHLSLVSSVWSFSPAGQLAASFTVRNTGWSRLALPRPLVLVLQARDGRETSATPIEGSLSEVPAAGGTATFSVALPAGQAVGSYTAFLAAPDRGASLRDDPRYNLLFENLGVPDVRTGLNKLAEFDFGVR